jgi:hypothetical protein
MTTVDRHISNINMAHKVISVLEKEHDTAVDNSYYMLASEIRTEIDKWYELVVDYTNSLLENIELKGL